MTFRFLFYFFLDYNIVQQPTKSYTINSRVSKSFRGKVIRETTFEVNFDNNGSKIKDIREELSEMFQEVIDTGKQNFTDRDVARVYINHPDLHHAIIVKPRPLHDLTPKVILERVDNVIQSAEGLSIQEGFTVQMGVAQILQGQGQGTKILDLDKARHSKLSIVSINNKDKLCLARSIVVGKAFLEYKSETDKEKQLQSLKRYNQLRRGMNSSHQGRLALDYHKLADVSTEQPSSLSDICKFERVLDIQIVVMASFINNKVIYQGEANTRRVYLLYSKDEKNVGHFDTITNVKALLGRKYFCHQCLKGYDKKREHECSIKCRVCESDCSKETPRTCNTCNRTCRSDACFERHLKKCKKYWQCPTCKTIIKTEKRDKEKHKCGEWLCNSCEQWQIGEHLCYLRLRQTKQHVQRFVFYDFETEQSTGTHIVNYVVAKSCCDYCYLDNLDKCPICGSRCDKCSKWVKKQKEFACIPCENCGHRQVTFNNSVQFCKWLFTPQHSGCVVMAHNGKAFDHYFLVDYLMKNTIIPKIIFAGSKIIHIHIPKLDMKILDSICFLPMRLAKLPQSFSLTELKKGYFPHFFNRPENQDYVGPMPPIEMYGIDTMMAGERSDFLKWYDIHKDDTFIFRSEMHAYCESDVDILLQGAMAFRSLVMKITGTDPFSEITIASVCMQVFRTNFFSETWELTLPDDTKVCVNKTKDGLQSFTNFKSAKFIRSPIVKIPAGSYSGRDNFSKDSIVWLEYEARRRKIHIRHALNGGEIKIPNGKGRFYKIDGSHQNLLFEYNGKLSVFVRQ